MQIKMLYSLLELYKTKNISKTSDILFITQQGLSRQIQALEKELGVTLFVRKKDGVVPTEICHQLVPFFHSTYESYIEALHLIDAQSQRRLRIGFVYSISHGLNNHFMVEFKKTAPSIHLEIQEWTSDVCREKLLSGELDLAILIEPFPKSNIDYQVLCQDNMYAAMHVTHPFATSTEQLPFQSLEGQQIITGSPDNSLCIFFDYCCKLTKVQPQILISSSYNVDFVNSMSDNMGIAPLTSAMSFRINNPEVRIRQLILPVPGNMYICKREQGKNASVKKQFISFCIEYFQKNPLPRYAVESGIPSLR